MKTNACPFCKSVNKPAAMSCRICGQRIREPKKAGLDTAKPIVLERAMSGEIFSAIMGKVDRKEEHESEKLDQDHRKEECDEKGKKASDLDDYFKEIDSNLRSAALLMEAEDDSERDSAAATNGESPNVVSDFVEMPPKPNEEKTARAKKRIFLAAQPNVTITINTSGVAQSTVPTSDGSHDPASSCELPDIQSNEPPLRARVKVEVPRIKTYVEGFDEALDGGIPEGHVIIISGSSGTMKSTLSFYIAASNATIAGHKALYVTLEENSGSLLRQAMSTGIPLDQLGGNLAIIDLASLGKKLKNTRQNWLRILKFHLEKALEQGGFKILVLDSLDALEVLGRFKERRREIFGLFQWLRDLKLTTIVIAERPDVIINGNIIQGRWDEEFLADGIIQLRMHRSTDTDVQRRIRCVKMRGTRHETNYMAMLVDEGAFRVTKALSS